MRQVSRSTMARVDDDDLGLFNIRLEEAIDGSKKTSTSKIQESLNILGEMKEHYEENCK